MTTHRTVTSVPSILLASTGRIDTVFSTPTFDLPVVQLLTAKKFLYQRSERPDSDDEATTAGQWCRPPRHHHEAQDGSQPFSQCELNDLVRDLSLSKTSSELLASRLKEKNLLGEDARITFFRRRHEDYMFYFCQEEDLVYCRDVAGLLAKLGAPQYDPRDWRLFIDSCKRSLKCVLLHNGNQFASIPLAYSTTLEEKYEAVKYVLDKIQYEQHQWIICVDLYSRW